MRTIAVGLIFLTTVAAAQTYALDAKKSELVVKTWKAGIAAALAHNHVVQATEMSGELTWDPQTLAATKVKVTVCVAALVADRPSVRKKHGEPNEVSASDQKKVTDAMLGEDQLDVKKFPTLSFESSGVAKDAKGAVVITGKLTLHGVTREVSLPVKIEEKDGEVEGDGTLRLRVSDYQIQPYSTALGSIKNRDEVELVLHLVGTKK